MPPGAQAAAFFDADHTVLRVNSGTAWMKYLRRRGEISRYEMARAGVWAALYKLALLDMDGLARRLVADLEGQSVDEMRDKCARWWAEEVRHEIKALQAKLGIATIHVTHDREEAMVMADRIAILDAGRIAQLGSPEEVYNRPNSPFVAAFMGAANVLALEARPADGGMRSPIVSLSMTNVSLEGGALTLFKGTSDLGRKIDDGLMELCYDYNWADEVTHVSIGDYFVKMLSEGDPRAERIALLAHARHEMTRAGALTEAQMAELKAFFDEEMERAEEALVGGGEPQGEAKGYQ